MTDKEIFEKLEAEIERLENYENENVTSSDTRFGWIHGKTFALTSIRVLLDSMQKNPQECMYARDNYTNEDRKALCDGCEEKCAYAIAEWQKKKDDYAIEIAHMAGEEEGKNIMKQQMMAKAVKVNISNASIVSLPLDCNLKVGDKVLLIKE